MKVLKEAFITKTSIDEIVSAAEKHPVAIERLKKIRDQKKERDFEALINEMYPNGIGLENLFDLLENDIDLVEEEIGIKFEVNEALTQSDKYIPHLRGRSFHTMTTDRKFDVDVDEEGNVVASERHFPRRYFSGHISNKVSEFPYTDEDNIILAAREQHKRNFGKEESLTEANTEDVERQLERAKSAGDDTQAWDLALCIENDDDIYNRFVTPAIKNLQRKNKRGIYDRTLAVQLFYYVVENSLKYGPRWFPYKLKDVTVPTRYLAAEELYNFFEDEIKSEKQ